MTRSLVLGLIFVAWGMAVANPPAIAQTSVIPGSKLPGAGEDITELLQDRNGVTIATGGEITGVHPNELLISYGAKDVTAADGGQTIVVGSEETNPYEVFYRINDEPTTRIVLGAPSPVTPHIEECLIFDIAGNVLSARSTDSSTDIKLDLQPVIITSYTVSGTGSGTGIKIDIEDGKITATDMDTGHIRVTGVHNFDGTLVDAETIEAMLWVHDGIPVPVGPGGDQLLHVVDGDNPDTFAPPANARNIILVSSRVTLGVEGGNQDDVIVVDARLGLPNVLDPIPLDGGGGDDVYVVRSAAGDTRDLKITVREGDEDIVMLADFSSEFEKEFLGDGHYRFTDLISGVQQVIQVVDPTGAPMPDDEDIAKLIDFVLGL